MIETVDELVMQGRRELSQLAADFTWYLRNLLREEVRIIWKMYWMCRLKILALLKEETQMIDSDTLIRYIRDFLRSDESVKICDRRGYFWK